MRLTLLILWLSVQGTGPQVHGATGAPRNTRDAVARGCLDGNWLRHARVDESGSTEDVRLRLSKAIGKALKEYQGHDIVLSGRLKNGDKTMDGGKSAKIGDKTKIFVGAREDHGTGTPSPRELEVTSFSDAGGVCHH
jgi:hypothetical protein